MTLRLEQVPVEEIATRAHQARPGRIFVTVILGVFFLLGWLAGKAWYGLADCAVAVRLGWEHGRGITAENPPPG